MTTSPRIYSCENREDHGRHEWDGRYIPEDDDEPIHTFTCPGQPFWCGRCGVQVLSAGGLGWFKYIDDETSSWLCHDTDPKRFEKWSLKHFPIGPATDAEVDHAVRSITRPTEAKD